MHTPDPDGPTSELSSSSSGVQTRYGCSTLLTPAIILAITSKQEFASLNSVMYAHACSGVM